MQPGWLLVEGICDLSQTTKNHSDILAVTSQHYQYRSFTHMDTLAQRFIEFAETPWAPVLLFVHSFCESSFLVGAHDIFLIAVTIAKMESAFFFAFFSTIGSACGGAFAYSFGRYFGRPIVEKLINKKIARGVETSYQKYGYWAVAFAGFTPVPYKIFAICSGFFEIKFIPFLLISLAARGARFFLVSGLIYFIGPEVKDHLLHSFNIFSIVFLCCVVILVVLYKRFKKGVKHDEVSSGNDPL
jgi:membrane protein YqaA with SNARE-associated domain